MIRNLILSLVLCSIIAASAQTPDSTRVRAWRYAAAGGGSDQVYALDFDGVNDDVYRGVGFIGGMFQTFTCWVLPDTQRASDSYIFFGGARGSIRYQANTRKLVYVLPGIAAATGSTSAISTGQWSHVAVTLDTDANEIKYYINGLIDSTVSFASNPDQTSSEFRFAGGGVVAFDGKLSDSYWYHRTLSSNEIYQVSQGQSVSTNNIYHHFPMTEGNGTTTADTTGRYLTDPELRNGTQWILVDPIKDRL
jgi:hypothetical protein